MTAAAQKTATVEPFCKACLAPLDNADIRGSKDGYDLLSCADCDTVTISPFPTLEEMMEFYQSYEGTTDYLRKKDSKIKRAKSRIKRVLPYYNGEKKRFLDIGSNYGFTVKGALDLGLDAKGIDIDNTAVTASQETFGGDYYECISVQDYAASGAKADIAYTADVIEHVPDPDSFIQALSQIIVPGGVLFLGTPDSSHWRIPKDFATWHDVIPPEHVTLFSRKGMRFLLEKHGFEIKKFMFGLKPGMRLVAVKK